MDTSTGLQILANMPALGGVCWFMLKLRSFDALERKTRDSSWQSLIEQLRSTQTAVTESQVQAMKELNGQIHGFQAGLMGGLNQLNATNTKMVALLVIQITKKGGPQDAKEVVELLTA